jgi:hypothetical protein
MRPIDVKKLVLMLCTVGILQVKPNVDKDKPGYSGIVLIPILGQHPITKKLLLYDDSVWGKIPQRN